MIENFRSVQWKVDECSSYFGRMRLRGWCFVPGVSIEKIEAFFPEAGHSAPLPSYGRPSPDVAAAVLAEASNVRFDDWIALPVPHVGADFVLRVHLKDGEIFQTSSVFENARAGDPAHACWSHFLAALEKAPPGEILEIGSRARSGLTVRQLIPPQHRYVGLDILAGGNVDVVGDAHTLSERFKPGQFTAAFSRSVFEHLAMPWKVVLELNRVLAPGGLVFVATHQTWVLHEEPWDFWRFSNHSWPCLFNAVTGFEIVEVAQGEPARVHAMWDSAIVYDLASHPAFLYSTVIARKISETALQWPVPTEAVTRANYPPGELVAPQSSTSGIMQSEIKPRIS
jgi:hypothetical protein